ncbi:hypothetical protein [Paenibacillus tianjinensis]|uniref:Uncharacterized protein n=1 Tax=Paenibacillus tianjinensis TaxID=2810347 RepID=A0ABX7LBU7_9BACL|nr:hypothetical protein [Paenibacillus tianjinensis]QSF43457.1 hypothetical protein JRJ22_19530 [Paenibacillus tianjinensis]
MIKIPGRKSDPHVTINGIEVDVEKLRDSSVSLEEYKSVRANTDGFRALTSKLCLEALVYSVENNLKNCRREYESTYDWSLKNVIVPELLKRLEERSMF